MKNYFVFIKFSLKRYWIPLLVGVVACLPTLGVPATSPRVAVLVRDISSLDSDENYLANFLSQKGILYDLADANMLKNGILNPSEYTALYMRTGRNPEAYQDPTVLARIKEGISAGTNLLLEYNGLYLAQYLGLGQAATTRVTSPEIVVQGSTTYFVEPLPSDAGTGDLFKNIHSWSPPLLPDNGEQLIAEWKSPATPQESSSFVFSVPTQSISYWSLTTSYGRYGQNTESDFCHRHEGLCGSDRSVQRTKTEDGVEFVPLGKGKVFRIGLDRGRSVSDGDLVFGPAADQLRLNAIYSGTAVKATPDFVVTNIVIDPTARVIN